MRDAAEELLTPRAAAEVLGVTVRTVQRWARDGRLPAVRVGGRVRVSRASLSMVSATHASPRPPRPITRLLIANRGEIAARVARTARRRGLTVVTLRLDGEPVLRGGDDAVVVPSYLDGEAIVAAALGAGADAVHPGYGFLAENADFAAAVERAGLVWVGPPPAAIATMGDKASARRLAAECGVPLVPGYDGSLQDDRALVSAAQRIGLPLVVKPSAGGGGKGMHVVRHYTELEGALAAARREALRAFDDDRLILERYLEAPRHVEVQLLFDTRGDGVHLGTRDCSAQRRHQKVVEEAPAPSVSVELRERMGAAALAVARAVGYVNAGTVEFLVADDGAFFFLEMNTRLQVEHAVTEAVTGLDLVAEQLRLAAGGPLGLTQQSVAWQGHAIEARLYAEDPEAGFLPASGRIAALRWPTGVRVDAGVAEGDTVDDRYDPLLAKIVAHGPDRPAALDRLRRALDETQLLGARTNLRFLRRLLADAPFAAGEIRTDTLERAGPPPPEPLHDAAWRTAATALRPLLPSGPWGAGWRMNAPAAVRVSHGEEVQRVELLAADAELEPHALDTMGRRAFVEVEGGSVEFHLALPPNVESAERHAAAATGSATLTAPMPGRVVAVRRNAGEVVAAHEVVVIIEAMKMEHAVSSPIAGRVERLTVAEGTQVQRGDELGRIAAPLAGNASKAGEVDG